MTIAEERIREIVTTPSVVDAISGTRQSDICTLIDAILKIREVYGLKIPFMVGEEITHD